MTCIDRYAYYGASFLIFFLFLAMHVDQSDILFNAYMPESTML